MDIDDIERGGKKIFDEVEERELATNELRALVERWCRENMTAIRGGGG